MDAPGGYLLDLDGTLYHGGAAIPGAVQLLTELRRRGTPFRLVTNTTTRSRAALVDRLVGYGFEARAEEIFTATLAGVSLLGAVGYRSIAPFVPAGALEDMGGLALSRDRFWRQGHRLTLDAGPFVAALEFASGKAAAVAGKPSAAFYASAVASLGVPASSVAMVGDDLWSDVEGAQRAGLQGWLVRTGKFREDHLRHAAVTPDRILASVAELL